MPFNALRKNNVTVVNDHIKDKTIVFAHGFGTDQTAWDQVKAAFKDEYRIIAYDNVGAGKADPEAFSPNKYDRLESYANDLEDICNALGVENAIMIAHSVSGMISILANAKNKDRFSKMVLVGASPRYLNDEGYVGGFDQATLDGFYETMSNNYFAWVSGFAPAAMANANKPQLAEHFADNLKSIRPDIAQSVARVIFQSDYREVLPGVDKPTLLLHTKRDVAVPMDVAHYLNKNIRNSRLEIVDAEGHFPHISAADKVTRAIKKFI